MSMLFKTYKNKSWYDKHITWCLENTSVSVLKREIEEIQDTPPVHTMFKMILDLATKVNHLEHKYFNSTFGFNVIKKNMNLVMSSKFYEQNL